MLQLTRRAVLGAIAAAAAAACAPRPSAAFTLDEVIRRHVEARGGAAALDRVQACLIDVEIAEGGQTLLGRYAADASGLVRIDIHVADALVYSEGVDREGVWLWSRRDPAPSPSAATGAANALLNGAEGHLFGLHRYRERGHRVRLMPAVRIEGVDHEVVEIAFTTGHVSYLYIDHAAWLIARRRDERAYHPDASEERQRIETIFSDYRDVDGALYAFRNVDRDLDTGSQLSTNQVRRRVTNPDFPEGMFARTYQPPARWE